MSPMRLVCISDTHNSHRSLHLPEGDVLIHAGDAIYDEPLWETSERQVRHVAEP